MTQQSIPLSQVKVSPHRMRKDLGDLTGLMDSIARRGLIQPIVLDHENNLIAGERRFRAHEKLGKPTIDFIYRDQVPEDVQAEIEFEENFWRKSFTWQEEALGILDIYRKKKQAAALEGWSESYQKIVAQMFGMSIGTINYILCVAKKLEGERKLPLDLRKYWNYTSAAEAYRLGILEEDEQRINKRLAEIQKATTNTAQQQTQVSQILAVEAPLVAAVAAKPDLLAEQRAKYESNPLNTIPFDEYWKEKQRLVAEAQNSIYISNRFLMGDSISLMMSKDFIGFFDHILTDPPYGIEMSNLDQANAGMTDIDKLEDTHEVDSNLDLLQKFFPAAWQCTKENAFVVTWCDQDNWELMRNAAEAAGFRVQRWAYIWRKINQSLKNSAPGYNTTKDYEIAMICRKPSATLALKRNTSFTEASNVVVTKETGHPFAKPYETTRDLLNAISIAGQNILDPFAGGGSIILEGLRQKRNMWGFELKEHWFNSLMTNVKNLYYLKVNPNYIFK